MSLTKKSILILFLACLLVSSFSITVFAQLKIGYVQPSYIFSKYEPYIEAERKIREYEQAEAEKLQKEGDNLKQKYETAQKQAALMSDDMRASTSEELDKQRAALELAYDDLYNQETGLLAKKQKELISPIIEEINTIFNRIGKDEEYDYILNPEEMGVLYADEKHDISEQVLEELNKGTVSP
ncbi:OmpH family outer membrane protein [Candidatus Latescibacterota bacterium]